MEQEYTTGNFTQWPIHDAFVTAMEINWAQKVFIVKATVIKVKRENANEP